MKRREFVKFSVIGGALIAAPALASKALKSADNLAAQIKWSNKSGLLILNPNATESNVAITYMLDGSRTYIQASLPENMKAGDTCTICKIPKGASIVSVNYDDPVMPNPVLLLGS